MNQNLNQIIDGALPGADITLPAGEFEGPVIIAKPLRISGKNTTVWAKKGSVIEIKSPGVSISDIRAELTESSETDCAIKAFFPADAKNVEVLGSVSGFGAEDGFFDVPRTINLGEFLAEAENTFTLSVNVPEKTEILCDIKEISISPKTLDKGRNDLTITVSGISEKTLLYAEILFRTRFVRRVYLMGKPKADIPAAVNKCIYTAPERDFSQTAVQPTALAESDVVSMTNQADSALPALEMKKGQRLSLAGYLGTRFSVWFTCERPAGMDIDAYVFLLDEHEKALGDQSLVFFGNESSPNGEVRFFPKDGHIEIDLAKVDYRVKKITLVYSIYAGSERSNFSLTRNARVSLRTDFERLSFVMNDLKNETTAVALELYLYKGEWKISVVGSGYNDGMARLCNSFGIQVEE
ncbi:MAG: TerD family protein [[Eubacterium] saphenum]|nr:TerD family protein [[Eubacterium] saphenum]